MERLERALAIVSYAVVQDGPAYAPILERLEREMMGHATGKPRYGDGYGLKLKQKYLQAISLTPSTASKLRSVA